jgi:cell division protease FtsH
MTKQTRFHIGYAVAAIFGLLLVQYALAIANQIAPIPYSQFQELLKAGKVAEIGVSENFVQGG